jgi:hypothetical protein
MLNELQNLLSHLSCTPPEGVPIWSNNHIFFLFPAAVVSEMYKGNDELNTGFLELETTAMAVTATRNEAI